MPTTVAGSSSRGSRDIRKASLAGIDLLFCSVSRTFVLRIHFLKNEIENIDDGDVRDFKALADVLLSASPEQLKALVDLGEQIEVTTDEQDEKL